jgi:hypothetical protein
MNLLVLVLIPIIIVSLRKRARGFYKAILSKNGFNVLVESMLLLVVTGLSIFLVTFALK